MMDDLDLRLLDDFQRDLPLVPQPFAAMAAQLGTTEPEVIARLRRLQDAGRIARVGATCRPNTAAASTLAALQVPVQRIEKVAELVSAEAGVNHSYLREGDWNLWFVATAPDPGRLAKSLQRIETATRLPVLSLPLVRAFNIDLGFPLKGPRQSMSLDQPADLGAMQQGDAALMQALSSGLALVPQPFAALARDLNRPEADIIARIRTLADARLLTRVGVIVKHRALGWRENAMVVWQLPEAAIPAAGRALADVPGVTLCYQRRIQPGLWDWPLFCMIHARSRPEAMAVLDLARALPELAGVPHRILFSTRCFRQRGATITEAAA